MDDDALVRKRPGVDPMAYVGRRELARRVDPTPDPRNWQSADRVFASPRESRSIFWDLIPDGTGGVIAIRNTRGLVVDQSSD